MKSCSASGLHERLRENKPIDLIDVRMPTEYRSIHVNGARLIPLVTLDSDQVLSTRPSEAQGPTYVLCKSGARAKKACEILTEAGLEVVLVEGGTDACVEAGVPVNRGKQAMSLERQVRIVAGSLVLVGVLIALFISPWGILLSGFVGVGLVFAGLTDFCGMGILLGRCPWNQ